MEEQKEELQIEEKKLSRLLRVALTQKERLDMGEQMANAIRNIKQATDELAAVSSQYKGKIKQFEAEIANVAERLNTGWEMRSVECIEIRNYSNMSKRIIRQDTFEVIEEKALESSELQMALFDGKPKETILEEEELPDEGQADNEAEEVQPAEN